MGREGLQRRTGSSCLPWVLLASRLPRGAGFVAPPSLVLGSVRASASATTQGGSIVAPSSPTPLHDRRRQRGLRPFSRLWDGAAAASTATTAERGATAEHQSADVVIIGSGIAGLVAGSLLSAYGKSVIVCESHTQAGGCAHGFERNGYFFDSGPSLFSGLSISPTPNPLKHVLNAIGEDVDWITYDTWGIDIPEGRFPTTIGPGPFLETLKEYGGPDALKQWGDLMDYLLEFADCTRGLPPFSLRQDPGCIITMAQYLPTLLRTLPQGPKLEAPFRNVMQDVGVTDPFIKNWLNLLCFLLQGVPAEGTMTAVMAYMIADWYRPGSKLDYPKGGTEALIGALVRGVEKHNGKVLLGAHVESVIVEDGKCGGVRLKGGKEIRAGTQVISNASMWDTLRFVPPGALPESFVEERQATDQCKSFMHVHLGVRASDIPVSDIECHYCIVQDWQKPIDDPSNVIIISIPSVMDPSLAPPGCHVVHAYTAGNEPYSVWEGMDPRSDEYKTLKEERAKKMMDAIEKVFPGLEDRLDVRMIGTPITHERFLRRDRGTYGPEIFAGTGKGYPDSRFPIEGLVCTGDSVWPGIGVPAVATAGTLAAHNLVSPLQQFKMMKTIDFGGV